MKVGQSTQALRPLSTNKAEAKQPSSYIDENGDYWVQVPPLDRKEEKFNHTGLYTAAAIGLATGIASNYTGSWTAALPVAGLAVGYLAAPSGKKDDSMDVKSVGSIQGFSAALGAVAGGAIFQAAGMNQLAGAVVGTIAACGFWNGVHRMNG